MNRNDLVDKEEYIILHEYWDFAQYNTFKDSGGSFGVFGECTEIYPEDCRHIIPLKLAEKAIELQAENERLRAILADMTYHLNFASLNGDKFAFHDPDMVIDNWLLGAKNLVDAAADALKGTPDEE